MGGVIDINVRKSGCDRSFAIEGDGCSNGELGDTRVDPGDLVPNNGIFPNPDDGKGDEKG